MTAPLMLGVSGLRGIVGQSLTPEVAARYAGAFGSWLVERSAPGKKKANKPTIVAGYDGRAGGDTILHAVVAGLSGAGCNVNVVGVAMTPTIGALVDSTHADAGVQITASHNPQEWNGIKVVIRDPGAKTADACAPDKTVADQIIGRFQSDARSAAPWDRLGAIADCEPSLRDNHPSTIAGLLKDLGLRRDIRRAKFRVALDCVGGSGSILTPDFLEDELHAKVDLSGEYTDGLFTHPPEPTRDNLAAFAKAAKKKKADVAFAQDPDADRLAILDERGRYIGEEYTLALAAESLLSTLSDKKRRGKKDLVLAANLSTSRMIDDIAAKHGARVVRTAVGEANVVEAMKREKAAGHTVVVGGEGNGGVIWAEVTYVRDSLSAMALVLSLMARSGKKLSELVADIPAYAIEKRKVDLSRKEDAAPAVEKLAAAHNGQVIDRQDGIRIDWPDRRAWLHVRASNTEPIMRLIAEAPTADEARGLLDDAAARINA